MPPDSPIASHTHVVFFKLKQSTEANRNQLVAKCHQYLSGHHGVLYFSVGTRAENCSREVNDKAFDVALHVVFESPEAHDAYQSHPRHLQFVKEMKANWADVRVFDSNLQPADR